MRGTRRLVWVIAAVMAAVLLASGVALAATLTGTNNGDTINGTENADTIDGKDGHDTIDGRAGEDTIEGGNGRDTIRGGNSDDEIYGGNKRGSITDGGNVIKGETGKDTIEGSPGADEVYGGENADTISGKGGSDTIEGGTGNDTLFGTDEYQTGIEDGNRTSTDGNDVIRGEDGDDTIVGASGEDQLYGGPGADTINEGPVNDAAVDQVYGGDGNDSIDVVSMPASKDHIDCGGGTDNVQADPLDVVASNCEEVETISASSSEATGADVASTTEAPRVLSEDELGDPPSDGTLKSDGDPPSDDTASAAAYYWDWLREDPAADGCWASPRYRGAWFCQTIDPYFGSMVSVGVTDTFNASGYNVNRDVRIMAWGGYANGYLGIRDLGEDESAQLYYSTFGVRRDIYMRTPCTFLNPCWRWTYVWSWWDTET